MGVVPALRHYPSADNFRAARFCAVGDVIWFVAFAVASDRLASTEGSTSPCRRRCGLRWRALDGLVYRRRVSGDACWRYALGHARVEAIPASEFYRLCAVAVDVDNQRCHATASFSFWFLALLRRCRCLTVLFFAASAGSAKTVGGHLGPSGDVCWPHASCSACDWRSGSCCAPWELSGCTHSHAGDGALLISWLGFSRYWRRNIRRANFPVALDREFHSACGGFQRCIDRNLANRIAGTRAEPKCQYRFCQSSSLRLCCG